MQPVTCVANLSSVLLGIILSLLLHFRSIRPSEGPECTVSCDQLGPQLGLLPATSLHTGSGYVPLSPICCFLSRAPSGPAVSKIAARR